MTHNHWEGLIPFYIAQTLPEGQALELAQHLKTCEACRRVYNEWREIAAAVQLAAEEWSQDLPPLSATVRAYVAQAPNPNPEAAPATQRTPRVVQDDAEPATDIKTQRAMPAVSMPTVQQAPPVQSQPQPPARSVSPAPVYGVSAPPPPPKLILLPSPPRKRRSNLPLAMAAAAVIVFALIGVFALLTLQGVIGNNSQSTPENIAMQGTQTETPPSIGETPTNERDRATPTFTVTAPITATDTTPLRLPNTEPTLDPSLFSMPVATAELLATEDFTMIGDATPEGGIGGGGGNPFNAGECPEVYFFGSACQIETQVIAQRFEFGMIVKRSDQDMALVIFDNGTLGEPYRVDSLVGAPLEGQFAPALAFMPYYRAGLGWAVLDPQVYRLVVSRTPDGIIQINLPDRMIAITGDLTAWATISP